MDETPGDEIVGDQSQGDIKARLSSILTPGESVLWAGRPAPGLLVRRSIPRSLFGLAFVVFTLFWMTAVVHGTNNNWDKGKAVAPFAPHNVLIAALAGLWFLPCGLYILAEPLRTWRKARRTVYALTEHRAVVVDSGRLDGYWSINDSPEALALLRCDERRDGTGNLVFEDRETWFLGMSQEVGFLAVERVREVEALVRNTFERGSPWVPERPGSRPAAGNLDASPTSSGVSLPRTYRFSGFNKTVHVFYGLFFLLATLLIAARIIVLPLALALKILPAFAAPKTTSGEPYGLAFSLALFAFATHRTLTTPFEIGVGKDRAVTFRGWFGTRTVPAEEIVSVKTGGWRDPNRLQAEVRYKGGRVSLVNRFTDFRDFLTVVKALNPAIMVKGF